jgi:hypothetical protein
MESVVDLRKYCREPKLGPVRKGRSESRISHRDEKMACRFYYHAELKKVHNYSKLLSLLAEEFDIDECVVSVRMRKRSDLLDALYKDKPGVAVLRRRFPYYSW